MFLLFQRKGRQRSVGKEKAYRLFFQHHRQLFFLQIFMVKDWYTAGIGKGQKIEKLFQRLVQVERCELPFHAQG